MKSFKITSTYIDDSNDFNLIKFFVAKHSFYPNIVEFPIRCDATILFERLKDKFNEFKYFSKSCYKDNILKIKTFHFLFSEGNTTIMFKYDGVFLSYYTNELDEGLLNVLYTIISSSNEK